MVKKGTRFGHYTKGCLEEEKDRMPWRTTFTGIASLDGRESKFMVESKNTVLRQKLRKAIQQAQDAAEKTIGSPEVTREEAMKWPKEKKKEWLREHFQIDEAPALHNKEDKEQALDLLLEFFDVVSINGEYGHTSLMQHDIDTGDHPPIRLKHRPVNPSLETNLRKQLEQWTKLGVIEVCTSPWSFPLVAAPKKGGKIRWCIDYRRLNDITRKDAFPLPNIEDNLVRLSHSTIFSALDGTGAFHVLSIKEKDRAKTAFSTPWGTFQFIRMPFGLTNGPASYSRLVQIVLQGIPHEEALPYLDDTIVHATDLKSHLNNLRKVLLAHREAGLRLQPSKCQLFRKEVDYLGHTVSAQGVSPMKEYVKDVQDWPMPTTKSEARTWIGKINYYRRFIKNYSAIAAPWTKVTGKTTIEEEKTKLEVTEDMKKSFEDLKDRLTQAPILAYPRFDSNEPFIMDTDWSQDNGAVGGVLSQMQDGQERVIMYGGKKMNKAQMNYSATKGELSALLYFMKTWRYYLQYRPFVVRTDHLPLKYMKTMEPMDGCVSRWLDTLAKFHFEIEYRAGKDHANADGMSRAPHIRDQPFSIEELGTDSPEYDDDNFGLNAVLPMDHYDELVTIRELKRCQQADEDLEHVLRWIHNQQHPDAMEKRSLSPTGQVYASILSELIISEDGLLCRRRPQSLGASRHPIVRCLPADLQDRVIKRAHEEGGHMASLSTTERIRTRFYFPSMRREVEAFIQACEPCQMAKRKGKDQRGLLYAPREGYPFQRISIDFVGPLQKSKRGNEYILTVRDTFTRWLEAFPLRSANTHTVLRLLDTHVFARYGLPDQIHSDRGAQFTSGLFLDVSQRLGIKATTTPAYNPKSNPVERAHRDLGHIMRACLKTDDSREWDDWLPQITFAMNTSISSATGVSPFKLLFGRDPATPLDILYGPPPSDDQDMIERTYTDVARKHEERIRTTQTEARKRIHAAVARQRRRYNLESKSFLEGSLVWLFTPITRRGESRKLTTFWTGPWEVKRRINDVMYEILPQKKWQLPDSSHTVSIDRLKAFREHHKQHATPPADYHRISLPGDDFAEFIDEDDVDDDPQPRLHPHDNDGGGGDDDAGGGGGDNADAGRDEEAPPLPDFPREDEPVVPNVQLQDDEPWALQDSGAGRTRHKRLRAKTPPGRPRTPPIHQRRDPPERPIRPLRDSLHDPLDELPPLVRDTVRSSLRFTPQQKDKRTQDHTPAGAGQDLQGGRDSILAPEATAPELELVHNPQDLSWDQDWDLGLLAQDAMGGHDLSTTEEDERKVLDGSFLNPAPEALDEGYHPDFRNLTLEEDQLQLDEERRNRPEANDPDLAKEFADLLGARPKRTTAGRRPDRYGYGTEDFQYQEKKKKPKKK